MTTPEMVKIDIPGEHDEVDVPDLLRHIADQIENHDFREGYHPRWALVPVDAAQMTRKAYFCPECNTEMIPSQQGTLMHVESTDCAPEPWPDLLSVQTLVIPDENCDRHGGPWGDDLTCERCTYQDGSVRPANDRGPLGPGAD